MCGFAGEIRFGGVADVGTVARMAETMSDRGPDGGGVWASGPIALAHRRLKIIDLSECGGQPMADPQLGLTIVFNGCVYNYPELRRDLEGEGYRFFSTSDTEVLLKAYHRWGERFVERLVGMFAFCIVERDSGRAILGRDRLGIKPLYLAEGSGSLRFASTLPALLAGGGVDTSIDPVALHHYMMFHAVVPAPRMILRGVRGAGAGYAARRRTRWQPPDSRVLGPALHQELGVRRHDPGRVGGRHARGAQGGRRAADGLRRPGRSPPLGRAGFEHHSGVARRAGPE